MASKSDQELFPELFRPDLNIDRRGAKRTVPLEVMNLSLPRSGTMSVKKALETLGYLDVYHIWEIPSNMRDCDIWVSLLKSKANNEPRNWRAEFDALLGHCSATGAAPSCYFAKELIEAYPEAKVILVERDFESWAKSFDVILAGAFNPGVPVFRLLDPLWAGRFVGMMKSFLMYYYGVTNANEARANLRDIHRRHNELVRSLVPRERLLQFDLASDWEPLCTFLGKKVPEAPFPYVNDLAETKRRSAFLIRKGMLRSLRKLTFVAGPIAVAALAVFGTTGKTYFMGVEGGPLAYH